MSDYKIAHANWHTINIHGATLIGDLPSDRLALFTDDTDLGIRTGVAIGPVSIAVDLLPGELPPEDQSRWEDIAEASIQTDNTVTVSGPWDDEPAHAIDVVPGPFRMKISARGRGLNYDEAVNTPTETYLVQLWPAPTAPTLIIKSTTRDLTD